MKKEKGEKTKNPFSDMIGKNVFIRSVTHHFTDKVVAVYFVVPVGVVAVVGVLLGVVAVKQIKNLLYYCGFGW
jgi:hypothetical protein